MEVIRVPTSFSIYDVHRERPRKVVRSLEVAGARAVRPPVVLTTQAVDEAYWANQGWADMVGCWLPQTGYNVIRALWSARWWRDAPVKSYLTAAGRGAQGGCGGRAWCSGRR